MQASTPLRLIVAIPTFRRPDRLASLLAAVSSQALEVTARSIVTECSTLVVDNDPDCSARHVVSQATSGTMYVNETKPGIPAVRNRALAEAAGARLLAFIDDDELPRPGWLESLVTTWSQYDRPAAVMGRVVSIFADDVDPWVTASGLFQRPQLATGTSIEVAATGNLLLDLDQVRDSGVRFDEEIGLGGGSDTLFSMMLRRTGARMVWCNESVTEDVVEPERQTRRWALQRAYSHGNVSVLVQLRLASSNASRVLVRLRGIAGGLARVVVGIGRACIGAVARSILHRARGRRMVYRGAGMVAAGLGRNYAAYARRKRPAPIT